MPGISVAWADFSALWMFTYNIPMVMNNFFYLMMILILVAGMATGVYAARAFKKAEAYIPADEAYEAKLAERKAAKGEKKQKAPKAE